MNNTLKLILISFKWAAILFSLGLIMYFFEDDLLPVEDSKKYFSKESMEARRIYQIVGYGYYLIVLILFGLAIREIVKKIGNIKLWQFHLFNFLVISFSIMLRYSSWKLVGEPDLMYVQRHYFFDYAETELLFIPIMMLAVIICSLWKIFVKFGYAGWWAIIPFANLFMLCKVAGKAFVSPTLLAPPANILVYGYISGELSKKFGRSMGFAIGLMVLPFIYYPILGFGQGRPLMETAV